MSARVASNPGSRWLIAGGILSALAALLHIGVILGGPEWYRFFGAGEEIAQAAERGEWGPPIMTMGIALILTIWAAYAFSGAGKLPKLFLLRTGLIVISAIYLLRGFALVPLHIWRPEMTDAFTVWSSLIVLAYGLAYMIGTVKSWRALSR
jgi:hypothetical protein